MEAFARALLRDALVELRTFADPLVQASRSQASLFRFCTKFGWCLEAALGADLTAVGDKLDQIRADLERLTDAMQHGTESQVAQAATTLARGTLSRAEAIYPLLCAASPAPVSDAAVEAFTDDLVAHLLTLYVARRAPTAFAIARLAGLVVRERAAPIYAEDNAKILLRYPVERAMLRPRELLTTALNPLFGILSEVAQKQPGDAGELRDALRDVLESRLRALYLATRGRGLDGMRVQIDHTGLRLVGGNWLPFPEPGSQSIRIEIPIEHAPVIVIDAQAWALEWLSADTQKHKVTLFEQSGVRFFLTADPGAAVTDRGFILSEENDALRLEAVGGIGVRLPLDVITSAAGDEVSGQAIGRLSYTWGDDQPALRLDRLMIAGAFHIGGAEGLRIENARLELEAMELPPPAPTVARPLPFDLNVTGTLVFPGEAATIEVKGAYANGLWSVESSGTVRFDNGIELLPVAGKPVLALDAQPAAGAYRFAAAGLLQFPQSAGAGTGQLALGGVLAVRMVDRLPRFESFEMSAAVFDWQLSADVTLRTLTVALGHAANRFTARLAAAIPFSDGFELELLDAIPSDLTLSATLEPELVIDRSAGRLDVRVTGGFRLRVPTAILTGGDGDEPVIAEAVGVFDFSSDPAVTPTLSNLAFALRANRLHLGGRDGLIVEDVAVVATAVDRLLALGAPPHPTLAFSGRVICPVDAPEGEVALSLAGARFVFEHADRLPRFEFADGGALGFESANLGGLPLEITQGAVRFKQGALPLPQLLAPANVVVSLGARLKLDFAGTAGVVGEIDRITAELRHGRPCFSLEGASAGVEDLSFGVMKLSGALGMHNLHDPLNIQLEGILGGSLYGAGVKALAAIKLENGVPTPLGVCLDVSAGPNGIPLGYGFIITGVSGGISYANSNADPCDFGTYAQARKPISSGRRIESRRPAAFDGCPCECPPPSLNILCQPHPDQETHAGRAIFKFSSIDEAFWAPIPLPGGATLGERLHQLDHEIGQRLAAATASFDPKTEAQRAADTVVDGASAAIAQLIPALDFGAVRPLPPPELRAQFERLAAVLHAPAQYWSEQTRRVLASELERALGQAKSGVTSARPSAYDIVKTQLYRGVSCPDETLQVTGTFSYTGVSLFLSVTGGVNVSTAGSIGVIGFLNVLSIPIGQLRAFVTVTSDVGDPEPSLCGDLRFEFGPLYLGQISLQYRCPGCVTNLSGTVARHGSKLGATLLQRVLMRIEQRGDAFHARAGVDPARPETVLAVLKPAEASQVVAQVLSDMPELSSVDAANAQRFVGEIAGELWSGFKPEIRLCGMVAPKLFGLPLGGELVQATGLIEKDHVELGFGFSPLYLLGRVLPIADLFSGMDSARMGVAMSFPTIEQLVIDGLTGQYASQRQFEQYLDKGLARLLRDAVFTFSYQLFPLGMKLADGQGRGVMPYLTPHPESTTSTWANPDTPSPRRLPARRTVLFAALDRGQLADIRWRGAVKDVLDLPAAQHQLDLQRDYFPHGGLLGAGKLQVPRLLWDAPPLDLLGRMTGGTNWLERLRAFVELARDWILATREAGTLAFYIPAPNPPQSLRTAPGDNLRQVIDSLLDLDVKDLMPNDRIKAGDHYALHLAFFEGYLAGRLLGIDIGTANVYFVPPSTAGGASELRAVTSVSADARLRAWVQEAKLEFVMTNPPADRALAPVERSSIEQVFTDLSRRAQKAEAAPAESAVTAMLKEAQAALAQRLPKAHLTAVVALQVPPELSVFMEVPAAATAALRAYSPCYDPSARGDAPDAVARRNGGLCLSGDLNFKLGNVWRLRAKVDLVVHLPADITQRARLVGEVEVSTVSGLKFLGSGLPLRNARLTIDSDPAPGGPLLSLRGDLSNLNFGQLSMQPLSGTALHIALHAVRTGNAAAVSFAMTGARVSLPCLASDTPLELRPGAGKNAIVWSASGGSATLAAPNGLKLLGPEGAVVLHLKGTGSGSLQMEANGAATLSVSLPAGVQTTLFRGAGPLQRDFTVSQALAVTLRSDGSFTANVKLPPLAFDDGLFSLHGAGGFDDPLSVVATHQAVTLAAPARLTLRVPNAPAQTALLDALTLRADGTLAASGSQATVQLPGLLVATASAFSFLRQGPVFRLKLSNAEIAFTALPGLVTRWNVELGTGHFSAQRAASGVLSCGFGTRISIDAGQWSVQATSFQSLTVTAASPTVKLLGSPLALPGSAACTIALASNGTLSAQLQTTGAVPLMPGLLELGIQRITLNGGGSASIAVEGRMRVLRRGGAWVADVAMSAQLDADHFETSVLTTATPLFSSSALELTANIGFGRDASGFYLALEPLRVRFLGVALAQANRTLRVNAPLTANWNAATIPLPPFALMTPSGSVSLDLANQTATLSLSAGKLETDSSQWPAGTANTPAIQCKWSGATATPGKATVQMAGEDGELQTGVAGVRYRVTQPSVRIELSLGAASPIAGMTLTGARLRIETVARRPDNDKPWASLDKSLGDLPIALDGKLALPLPALSPGTDPLKDLRSACEKTARSDIELPAVPSAPPGPRPPPGPARNLYDAAMKAYNDAVSELNKAKEKLEKALNDCGSKYPAPPAAASFAGKSVTVEVKRLFTLR